MKILKIKFGRDFEINPYFEEINPAANLLSSTSSVAETFTNKTQETITRYKESCLVTTYSPAHLELEDVVFTGLNNFISECYNIYKTADGTEFISGIDAGVDIMVNEKELLNSLKDFLNPDVKLADIEEQSITQLQRAVATFLRHRLAPCNKFFHVFQIGSKVDCDIFEQFLKTPEKFVLNQYNMLYDEKSIKPSPSIRNITKEEADNFINFSYKMPSVDSKVSKLLSSGYTVDKLFLLTLWKMVAGFNYYKLRSIFSNYGDSILTSIFYMEDLMKYDYKSEYSGYERYSPDPEKGEIYLEEKFGITKDDLVLNNKQVYHQDRIKKGLSKVKQSDYIKITLDYN